MALDAVTWALAQKIKPAGRKFVLVALANYANQDRYCYPSQKKLAELTCQSQRSVCSHLEALEATGYIRREARASQKAGQFASDGFYLALTGEVAKAMPKAKRFPKPDAKSASGPDENISSGPDAESSSGPDATFADPPDATVSSNTKEEADTKEKHSADAEPDMPKKKPWTSKACDLWEAQFGGSPPAGRIGRALKPLVDKHGEDEVLEQFGKYLKSRKRADSFKTAEDFANRYGMWKDGGGDVASNTPQRAAGTLTPQQYGTGSKPEQPVNFNR